MRAVLLTSALLAAACAERAASDELSFARVGVLGDSLAIQAAAEINDAMAPTAVRNESAIGRRLDQAAADARRLAGDGYEVVVVILGTNDARDGITQRDLDEIVWLDALLQPVRCLLWVPVHGGSGDAAFDGGAAAINQAVQAQPDIRQVEWQPRDAWLADDGIHLNDAGRRGLAAAIRAAVERC